MNAGLPGLELDRVIQWRRPCRPRILVVTDSALNFRPDQAFGLWRFLHGITLAAGVTNKPILTLGHRGTHVASVTIGTDTYTVDDNFNFATASPGVATANYDQIWMFGFASGGALSNAEVGVISEFMNGGGGVFATGDHGAIGQQMCGSLPRIRHMREWANIPMGTENDVNVAVNRIDTVVNPGSNTLYEFEDQSDDVPQRIYPNYKVTAASATQWQASVHRLLMLPGAPATRTEAGGASGFTQDIDVLPDHPHESVCYEVIAAATLGGTYSLGGQNFEEFRPSAATPALRIGAEIVAYAVSGGRSVLLNVWKPPVKPRMFGVISAYDGRQAQAYPSKTQRPGRVVCDSTWHHYVNINLDGVGTLRSALGTWSGGMPLSGTFTTSAALDKIYAYYRNIVSWLQPANRVWCNLWWDLVDVRVNPAVFEELLEVPKFERWRDFVGLGREAAQLIGLANGAAAERDLIDGILLADRRTEALGNLLDGGGLQQTDIDRDELRHGILGGMLAKVAALLPDDDPKAAANVLEAGPERHAKDLTAEAVRMVGLAIDERAKRAERTLAVLKEIAGALSKNGRGKA
ncbi:MAG: hypothetical protein ACREVR_05250 [Burkholderiales bacterium]